MRAQTKQRILKMCTAFCGSTCARLFVDKGATDLLGVHATQWTAFSTEERYERLSKLWFMPHVGTLAFSVDKDGNEKIILYKFSPVACNAV